MSHPIVLHVVLAALAAGSLWAQMTYRIPGRSVFLALPWLGPAVACLGSLLLINAVAGRISASDTALRRVARWALTMTFALGVLAFAIPAGPIRRVLAPALVWAALGTVYLFAVIVIAGLVSSAAPAVVRQALRWMERVALALVAGFIVVGVVAFVNGHFDASLPTEVKSQIRDIGRAEVELEHVADYGWADLRSWRRPGGIERVFMSRTERAHSWPGQAIVARVRSGALRLAWIVDMGVDVEEYNRQILAIAPNARGARGALIDWYLSRHRWQDATAQTLDYLDRFPGEFEYVREVAAKLGLAHQTVAARAVLERLVARHPTPAILSLTGWVMNVTGDRSRSIELLETAVRLDPGDWIHYYRLGTVYHGAGRDDDAIVTFEHMLERRPNYPEVERQLGRLREKVKERGLRAR
jgi:hypothetical protein